MRLITATVTFISRLVSPQYHKKMSSADLAEQVQILQTADEDDDG